MGKNEKLRIAGHRVVGGILGSRWGQNVKGLGKFLKNIGGK